ncbi:type II toxin-antitoxin system RelE/ParE family toxin [Moorella naiadis]|uniref:type II toxin-antitoxin system RelE/ParE family toxin n=1 Tax=Moorella naiadis (nom. illeg.) TaxID=3093670 RepID=UPI003D9C85E7
MSNRFAIHITRAVEDDLEDLVPYRERVVRELLALEDNPYKGHTLKGILRGLRSFEFSLPGGVCRAVYTVKENKQLCLIIIVGYHEGLYEKAERRVKALKRQKVLD